MLPDRLRSPVLPLSRVLHAYAVERAAGFLEEVDLPVGPLREGVERELRGEDPAGHRGAPRVENHTLAGALIGPQPRRDPLSAGRCSVFRTNIRLPRSVHSTVVT